MTLFQNWLAETHKLQTETYGYEMPMPDGDERAVYFAQQGFAAVVELGEMSQEIGWKPWGKDRSIDRDKFLSEGVDVLHFLGNLLVMAGITDAELNQAYEEKLRINRERAASGSYDGRISGKCLNCGRALDDPTVSIVEFAFGSYCGPCYEDVPSHGYVDSSDPGC